VVSHGIDLIEHPELLADRIITFAELVGRENVIAGTNRPRPIRKFPGLSCAISSKKLWS
jgi:hypothetical protein